MFAAYADVPGYPLVFPLFYGAMAYFALAMARHLRIFAATVPSGPFASVPRRAAGVFFYALAQARMFRDARAGLMHIAIFRGFVALTIGTADIVTGGLVQAIVGWPLNGALWTGLTAIQNVAAVGVLLAVGFAAWRRLVSRPPRLALTRGALVILGLIGGLVLAELLAMALEAARSGDRPGAIVANALAVPLRGVDPGLLAAGFAACWWAHFLLVAAFLCCSTSPRCLPPRSTRPGEAVTAGFGQAAAPPSRLTPGDAAWPPVAQPSRTRASKAARTEAPKIETTRSTVSPCACASQMNHGSRLSGSGIAPRACMPTAIASYSSWSVAAQSRYSLGIRSVNMIPNIDGCPVMT